MALAGVELEALVSETDALTTRPPPCATIAQLNYNKNAKKLNLHKTNFKHTHSK